MAKLLVIADDLTGANDTGVQFAKRGLATISLLEMESPIETEHTDVLVYNAETRSLTTVESYEKIKKTAASFCLSNIPYIYKKIDSMMRGNIGAEIDALLEMEAFDIAIVAPAYPKNRRITIGGYHLVNHHLLEDSEAGVDAKSPVRESYLPTLLATQTEHAVAHVEIAEIRRGGLLERIRSCLLQKQRIVVCDSVTDNDLKSITEAVWHSGLRILWVGSAGLAECLAEKLENRAAPIVGSGKKADTQEVPVFCIAGSVSAVTREQLQTLSQHKEFVFATASLSCIFSEEGYKREQERLVAYIISAAQAGCYPVLTTEVSAKADAAVRQWMEVHDASALEAGNRIAEFLGETGAAVVGGYACKGLILTGGDIAYKTCESLDVQALRILGEVEEGIPLCEIVGGQMSGLSVITKAGAFGNADSLFHSVQKIKNM
ncbi:four-carbon acid sugar kinase family protein [Aneurinibacillus sp. REN35]|uniref:four-carbon acid sugar kinase family protein n=1 Tax=Aneurinibacillus sp. REN35 TaxID=3237286 RepID=UPI003527B7EB